MTYQQKSPLTLLGKRVVLFAAYGAIAREVARQAAMAGAEVLLAGRDATQLQELQTQIESEGGKARAETVDATDAGQVGAFLTAADADGGFDAVFNGIGLRAEAAGYATPSAHLPMSKFLLPLEVILGSTFLTAALAAPLLAARGRGGSIVTLSATLSGAAMPMMAGITATCGAIEAMTRSLAGEYGRAGVRVNCVRATAMPATRSIRETNARFHAAMNSTPPADPAPDNLIHCHITVADTAGAAVFLMSDASGGMTGQVVNVCGGALLG